MRLILNKISFSIFAVLCICIGLYPLTYFMVDRSFGLLSSKSEELLSSVFWNTGFYAHILLGGLALLIGWLQFSKKLRTKKPLVHKRIGKVYVISALISGTAGIYIGFNATGGIVSASGFISLGVIWLVTTWLAYRAAIKKDFSRHQYLMIFSYAACFAAVTLRIWLPMLIASFDGEFIPAYQIVAWLCWVPNILVAFLIVQQKKKVRIKA